MEVSYSISGGDFSHAGAVSSEVKKLLRKLNVPVSVMKRAVIAVYESEVNIVAHAYEGLINVNIDKEQVKVYVKDKGPGIADISLAMQEGWSTASQTVREMGFGAGMGLPNIKKNTDEFSISSKPGVGTELKFSCHIGSAKTTEGAHLNSRI